MPGTIQVTVLEFKSFSSSSQPSAKSLKVSMGKRHFQTWDKGDFSFPITKLGENLVVSLLDAGGNEIANADIQTMQIIEKGIWDEVFSMEGGGGGGNVHMKLRFFLSEEDRNRIRVMRESVIKKKHAENNPNINLRLSDSEQVSDSQKKFVEVDAVRSKVDAERRRIIGSAIPNATDIISQGASSSPQVNEKIPAVKIETHFPFSSVRSDIEKKVVPKVQDGLISKQQNQEPLKKTPSNVRKMISAFESTKLQEVKSLKKSASVPTRLNRVVKESLQHDIRDSKVVVIQPAEQSLRKYKDLITANVDERADNVSGNTELPQAPNEVESSVTPTPSLQKVSHVEDISKAAPMERIVKELERSPVRLTERTTESGRTNEEQFQVDSSDTSVTKERETGLKGSTIVDIQVASNHEPKSRENYKEDYFSSESSGMWIFPDNTRRLCITTAGEEDTRIQGHDRLETRTRQEKKISSVSETLEKGTKYKMAKDNNVVQANLHEHGSGSSSPDDSSNGLIGQVMKIVVVLGFGLLVLLTRQKEPRKEEKKMFICSLFQITLKKEQ
ncbi:hypothetical protein ACJIZ3_018781 [Penstemon smallii]|uniref:Uncharacterized protein n=1 Tax=Penstemon smallii TaxID=265156 RepID=A0ABD3SZA5_9LAMI